MPRAARTDETDTSTVTQTGNSVTIVVDGITYTGVVIETTYTVSASYPEDGGTATVVLTFTLSSSTSGSGTVFWYWDDGLDWCRGGSDLSLTKKPRGDGGGGGGCLIGTTAYGSLR